MPRAASSRASSQHWLVPSAARSSGSAMGEAAGFAAFLPLPPQFNGGRGLGCPSGARGGCGGRRGAGRALAHDGRGLAARTLRHTRHRLQRR
eukprot:1782507-Prymnesium_polylepis.1